MRPPPASSYPDPVWKKINQCADKTEALLKKRKVRLTMGGEPTFLPVQPDGEEWHTAALGPTKLTYARRLAKAMIRRDYPGAVTFLSSGKQYPGEPIPRWNLNLLWRQDGQKLWSDLSRLRLDQPVARNGFPELKAAMEYLAKRLELQPHVLSLHESESPQTVAGFVLPLDHSGKKWFSDTWPFTPQKPPVLIPGDSSAGLRLPLFKLHPNNLRKAFVAQVVDGGIDFFFPPLEAGPFLQLLSLIEETATTLNLVEITCCGYLPASDPNLKSLSLSSDPGVIEVNLPPVPDWKGYDLMLHHLYEAAEGSGLCGHKYNFNGRLWGSGGGSHLCFGGPTPQTSPYFSHPNLLPSILRFWQNHPSLSYFFTGQFMGPSSQAPRVDESTYEAMYELGIACQGAEKMASNPYLYAMLFRDLLVDKSGNTHRAEVSVDKLWNPYAPNGALGILEFRAFETMPEAKMLSLIGLFIRSVITALLLKPYDGEFHPWGLELHERFFLPSAVWEDVAKVVSFVRRQGIPFELDWLKPIWEFRFPKAGELDLPGGGKLEVRHALEAWPLLGEQPAGGGTARSVDSSTDRVEIRLSSRAALQKGRLYVNGHPAAFHSGLPHPVLGVRYRSFYCVPGLHPHIGNQSPLLLEWTDLKGRVKAAARYHSWSPSGKSYPSRPATPEEALPRCAERWESINASQGGQRKPPAPARMGKLSPSYTLDLRRIA
jgi:uncharacterized protein (DUF2126 family)